MDSNDNLFLKVLKKISSLIVFLRYPRVPPEYKYFYRDTFVCQLYQLRYFIQDRLIKKKYRTFAYDGEFGAELEFVLPHIYWHYKNGTLKKTVSLKKTKELYFFSPCHEELFEERTFTGNHNFEFPRVLYSQNYNMKKWIRVPLKEMYKNEVYVFNKPALIIANRYNSEWDGEPISFFSIETLDHIITKLKDKYTIIYNRPLPKDIVNDNSNVKDLNEYSWLEERHPEVLLMNKLFETNQVNANNFNHFQLCVYANCSRFISVHGGTAALASYFGGLNLVFSRQGPEHHFNCFHKLYPQLSGAKILHAKTNKEVEDYVERFF